MIRHSVRARRLRLVEWMHKKAQTGEQPAKFYDWLPPQARQPHDRRFRDRYGACLTLDELKAGPAPLHDHHAGKRPGSPRSPAIGSNDTIYVGSDKDHLYAVKPDGAQKWAFSVGDVVISSPAIGPRGIIYFGSFDSNLYAVH